jgi:hypothetical protein
MKWAVVAVSFVVLFAIAGCGNDQQVNPTTSTEAPPVVEGQSAEGEGAESSTTQEPTTTAAPVERVYSDETVEFSSPTGNIHCLLAQEPTTVEAAAVECAMEEHDWTAPPRPSDCPLDWGEFIAVSTTGPADFTCRGDAIFAIADPLPLPYGDTIIDDERTVSCTSERTGMTCRSESTGAGFTISRESYELFGEG